MEKKLGVIIIAIKDRKMVPRINTLLGEHGDIILSRQGLNINEDNIQLISLFIKSEANIINSLTGKIGRLNGVKVRTLQLSDIE
ncbi:MAG: CopG family transcriptional regulator [Marinilabiliales bacterium]|nr:MAG: CopG family transcriptional regulator [Marinilabiliales bacterium]